MKKIKFIFPAFVAFFLTLTSNAQDTGTDTHTIGVKIPAIAILDIEGGTGSPANIDIDFTEAATKEAGTDMLTGPASSNTELWLNYSSIVASTLSNKVQVSIDALLDGMDIKVTAGTLSATGEGDRGGSAGEVTLSTTDQDVVTSIGSCYTGDGTSSGRNLTYSIAPKTGDYGSIVANPTGHTITVTYTIVGDL